MITYVKHSDIDFTKWDDCINASPNGLIYALSWYLNTVAGEWDALVEDDYQSIFPLFPKRKVGISYSFNPKWTQQLGLFSKDLITAEKSYEFLNYAIKQVRWFDMNLNSLQKLPDNHKLNIRENNNFVLNVLQPYEQIYASYSENHRRNLKKGLRGMNITSSLNHEEIIRLFRNNRGKTIHLLNDESYAMLSRLIYQSITRNMVEITGLYDDTNTLVGGTIIFIFKGRAILIFSGINKTGRALSAMHFLIDDFVQKYQEHDLLLDFEGSNNENLARFYRGFGAVNSPYFSVAHNRLPIPSCLVQMMRSKKQQA